MILWDDTDRFPRALSPFNIENYINPKRMFKVRPAEQAYLDVKRYEEKPEHYKAMHQSVIVIEKINLIY